MSTARRVVDQPHLPPQREQRNDHDLLRQHEGVDDDDQQRAPERELQELEGVGRGRREQHRAEGGDAGELKRDPEGLGERILAPDPDPGIEREGQVVEPPPAEHDVLLRADRGDDDAEHRDDPDEARRPTTTDHPARGLADHLAPAVRWMMAGMDTIRTATSRITVAAAP